MARIAIDGKVWMTRDAGAARPLPRAVQSRAATLVRTIGVTAMIAFLSATIATVVPPPPPAEAADRQEIEPAFTKQAIRLGARPSERVDPRIPGLFEARPMGPSGGFGQDTIVTGSLHANPAAAWREREFDRASVADGRTLEAGGLRIRLEGIDLPEPGQMCRTLDGRDEPCLARAATQLELLTRHRRIACRFRGPDVGEVIGSCRLGTQDLAGRMLKTGYVYRSGNPPMLAQATEESEG